VGLLFGTAAVFDFRQALMQLNAIHTTLPKLAAVIYVYRSSGASAM
jgi:hypothetical protein